jgi:hypothetical protein
VGGSALARLFQGLGKGHDRGIALVGIFRQGCEDDLLDSRRQGANRLK